MISVLETELDVNKYLQSFQADLPTLIADSTRIFCLTCIKISVNWNIDNCSCISSIDAFPHTVALKGLTTYLPTRDLTEKITKTIKKPRGQDLGATALTRRSDIQHGKGSLFKQNVQVDTGFMLSDNRSG